MLAFKTFFIFCLSLEKVGIWIPGLGRDCSFYCSDRALSWNQQTNRTGLWFPSHCCTAVTQLNY